MWSCLIKYFYENYSAYFNERRSTPLPVIVQSVSLGLRPFVKWIMDTYDPIISYDYCRDHYSEECLSEPLKDEMCYAHLEYCLRAKNLKVLIIKGCPDSREESMHRWPHINVFKSEDSWMRIYATTAGLLAHTYKKTFFLGHEISEAVTEYTDETDIKRAFRKLTDDGSSELCSIQ